MQKTKKAQNKRRNYFIKKEFQTKFILKFCILIGVACLVMGILVYVLSAKTVTTSFENLRLVAKNTADYILPALVLSSLIAIFLVTLACIAVVLFISHRIAGPLYRFERSMEQIAGGDLTVETRLRQTDEIKVLAQSLNDLAEKLREVVVTSQRDIKRLDDELVTFERRLMQHGVSRHEVEEVLNPYREKLNQLNRRFSYFKVERR